MKFISLPFSSIVRHWDLLNQLTTREVQARHRGSWLGRFWLVFQPLLLLAVYTFVFSTIFDGGYGVIDTETSTQYALGIFYGIAVLHLFNDSLGPSVSCIASQPNYVKKVVFPLEIIPVSLVFGNLYNFAISLSLALGGTIFLGGGLGITALWLPIIVFPIIFLGIGVTWSASAIGVFYRDINPVVQVGTLCMLWISAVFYSARDIPPAAWEFIRFNPVLLTIESVRDVVLWRLQPNLEWLLYCYLSSFAVFFIGFWIFRSLRGAFADVI